MLGQQAGDEEKLLGDLEISKNRGTTKSSILIGFSLVNHPFRGFSPYFWKHPFGGKIPEKFKEFQQLKDSKKSCSPCEGHFSQKTSTLVFV